MLYVVVIIITTNDREINCVKGKTWLVAKREIKCIKSASICFSTGTTLTQGTHIRVGSGKKSLQVSAAKASGQPKSPPLNIMESYCPRVGISRERARLHQIYVQTCPKKPSQA